MRTASFPFQKKTILPRLDCKIDRVAIENGRKTRTATLPPTLTVAPDLHHHNSATTIGEMKLKLEGVRIGTVLELSTINCENCGGVATLRGVVSSLWLHRLLQRWYGLKVEFSAAEPYRESLISKGGGLD